jgi:hypothetical protein
VFSAALSESRVLGSELQDIGNLPDLVDNLHLLSGRGPFFENLCKYRFRPSLCQENQGNFFIRCGFSKQNLTFGA